MTTIVRETRETKIRVEVGVTTSKISTTIPFLDHMLTTLARYAGVYTDPWYGNIEVAVKGKDLTIDFKSTSLMSYVCAH